MINNQDIKSGADLEILLGGPYLKEVFNTFFEAEMIPEMIELAEGYSIKINKPQSIEIIEGSRKDLRIKLFLTLYNPNGTVNALVREVTTLDAKLDFKIEKNDADQVTGIKLKVRVVDFSGGLSTMIEFANLMLQIQAETNPDSNLPISSIPPVLVLAMLNEHLGQERPLNIFNQGTVIRDLKIKKFTDDPLTSAFGIYLNLNLKEGPEPDSLFENEIDLNEAINFLPSGKAIAFGMNDDAFTRFGTNVKQTFAEEKNAGKGDWHYPLKDNRDKVVGRLSSIKLGAYKTPIMEGLAVTGWENKNHFYVEMKGEVYVDEMGIELEPDFRILVGIIPKIVNGKLEWETSLIDTDIDLTFWEELKLSFTAGFIIGWVLGVFTGPIGLILGAGITTGVGLLVTDTIADAIGENMVEGMYKDYVDASMFEAMPDRVTTIWKRYDPFYWTQHQVVSLLDMVKVNDDGFSFCGNATTGIETTPVEHVVYKDEIRRENGEVFGFDVRVKDYQNIDPKYIDNHLRRDPENHPDRFAITLAELDYRKAHKKFSSRLMFFYPFKIDVDNGRINRIMTISDREKKEIEDKYVNPYLAERGEWFEANKKEETMQEVEEEYKGDNETEKERRYNAKKNEWLEAEEKEYRRSTLPPLYRMDAEKAVSFDMHPNEYGKLQVAGYLALVHIYKLIYMKNTGRFHYRTKANITKLDNLSEFPQYETSDTMNI